VTLLDSRGRKLAVWRAPVKAGASALTWLLPSRARRQGHETLRIAGPGVAKPLTVRVTVVA